MPDSAALNNRGTIRLLTDPRYRIARHALAILGVFLLSLNAGVLSYSGTAPLTSGVVIVESVLIFIVYLAGMYFNLYVLAPRLLLTNNYLIYILAVGGVIITIEGLNIGLEYLILHHAGVEPGLYSYFYSDRFLALDLMTEFFGTAVCIAGTTISILLRQWVVDDNMKNRLEKTTLRQQAEEIQNRISPSLLFRMLDAAAESAQTDSRRSSSILMGLSRFLRYRLYDSSREWVFLNSEIDFLDNYLQLESSLRQDFAYSLRSECADNGIPLPPMLFFSVVNYVVRMIPDNVEDTALEFVFSIQHDKLILTACTNYYSEIHDDGQWCEIGKRLEQLYPEDNTLERVMLPESMRITMKIPVLS